MSSFRSAVLLVLLLAAPTAAAAEWSPRLVATYAEPRGDVANVVGVGRGGGIEAVWAPHHDSPLGVRLFATASNHPWRSAWTTIPWGTIEYPAWFRTSTTFVLLGIAPECRREFGPARLTAFAGGGVAYTATHVRVLNPVSSISTGALVAGPRGSYVPKPDPVIRRSYADHTPMAVAGVTAGIRLGASLRVDAGIEYQKLNRIRYLGRNDIHPGADEPRVDESWRSAELVALHLAVAYGGR